MVKYILYINVLLCMYSVRCITVVLAPYYVTEVLIKFSLPANIYFFHSKLNSFVMRFSATNIIVRFYIVQYLNTVSIYKNFPT